LFVKGYDMRTRGRGDGAAAAATPRPPRLRVSAPRRRSAGGWTLIELVIVVTVLSILSVGVIPLARTAVRRQKETRLREALREMRESIKDFHRDTVGAPCCGAPGVGGVPGQVAAPPPPVPPQPGQPGVPGQQQLYLDPRSKVAISDRTIFDTRNLDHYPPTLQILVEGVNIVPRLNLQGGGAPDINQSPTAGAQLSLRKKIYLRRIPDDPMTEEDESSGEAEWGMRSCYDEGDSSSWDGINVFDVYSKSEGTALNGEKYSDW
jgi:general secretion pathway protein G